MFFIFHPKTFFLFLYLHYLPPLLTPSLSRPLLRRTSRLQNLERTHQRIIHSHHGTRIIKLSTIVGCRKHRHQFAIGKEFVSVFDDLMGSHDEVEVMAVEEFVDDVYSEGE